SFGCARRTREAIVATVNGRPITIAMVNEKIEKLPQYYQAFAAQHKKEIVDEMIVEGKAHKEVHVWTVDEVQTAKQYQKLGVDSVTSNKAGWLKQQLSHETGKQG
ncbi:MAG: hypothetical protein R6W69_15140, partial [Anaerolineales bacterium]